MPSQALLNWKSDRLARLAEIAGQCAASASPTLADENLRGYVALLSAHFQGFCRDLYTEASQVLAAAVPASVRLIVTTQFQAQRLSEKLSCVQGQ